MKDFEQYYSELRAALMKRVCQIADIPTHQWQTSTTEEKENIAQQVMYDVFTTDGSFHPLLNSHKDHMYELVRMMDPKMADVVCAFIPNLLNYTVILATHLSLLDEYTESGTINKWEVGGEHIEMSAEIIYDLYEELVTWLESEVELEHVSKAKQSRQASWTAAFNACKLVSVEDRPGDWVRKSELLSVYAKQNGGVSRNTQFLHFKDARDLFTEVSIGVTKYLQLSTEQ